MPFHIPFTDTVSIAMAAEKILADLIDGRGNEILYERYIRFPHEGNSGATLLLQIDPVGRVECHLVHGNGRQEQLLGGGRGQYLVRGVAAGHYHLSRVAHTNLQLFPAVAHLPSHLPARVSWVFINHVEG